MDKEQICSFFYTSLRRAGGLTPNRDPDEAATRRLLIQCLKLSASEAARLNLVQLARRCLQLPHLTTPLARAVSSAAVYAEYTRLPSKQGAPLLCSFASLITDPHFIGKTIDQRFSNDSFVRTLVGLGPLLDSNDGIVLRSKGYIAAKDAVPADSRLHFDDFKGYVKVQSPGAVFLFVT